MDVKGGEGQSIGHLLVPSNTEFLAVWSERNARNTKSPAGRLNEVINRIVRWGFNQDEDVAMMIIRDSPAGARTDEGEVIPDIVVFPERFPTPEETHPLCVTWMTYVLRRCSIRRSLANRICTVQRSRSISGSTNCHCRGNWGRLPS